MMSTKPYLLRALYEWCLDQGLTPYLQVLVNATTRVPREHVREGQIVLNIGPDATHQMSMGNEEITFQARFNGSAFPVKVPVAAVMAIYARENGQGMAFEPDVDDSARDEAVATEESATDKGALEPDKPTPHSPVARSHLTRIK